MFTWPDIDMPSLSKIETKLCNVKEKENTLNIGNVFVVLHLMIPWQNENH